MAQLWGGRFQKETSATAAAFTSSITFDNRFYHQDVQGSIAHVKMLAKQNIINNEEKDAIVAGLQAVEADLDAGKFPFTPDHYEDIHSLVETELINRVGDVGKKLHTGRSRNDQCVTDMKLYTLMEAAEIRARLVHWVQTLVDVMEQHVNTIMPGFTHMQKAQPVTLAHHLGAYVEMALRDVSRLDDMMARADTCPLGAAALAGTSYPLDRQYTAKLLGFSRPTDNSMDSVSDRDHICELAFDMSMIAMHLSRFCEEVIMWTSDEYRFMVMDDAWSTGSSIMPQKKNSDVAELMRGRTGRVYGALMGILTMLKGLPLSFNTDMQEDKEGFFDAIDVVKGSLLVASEMVATSTFKPSRMAKSAATGFTNATEVADYLVRKGMAFRDAHSVAGHLVLRCLEEGCDLLHLPFADYKDASDLFEEDVFDVISMEACVNRHNTHGGPAPAQMEKSIAKYKAWLAEQE
ncbi:MAG: argininosuccinate lyase [Clostridia bacterium]|nr:argininosuccinate lyase [Clostridia bacterium]